MHKPAAKPTVSLKDVTVDFGEGPLLTSLSLTAYTGEIVAIRGPNGSGKTSLLRLVANVARPTDGARTGPGSCAYVPSTIDPLPLRAGDWLRLLPRSQRSDPRRLLHDLKFDSDLSKKLPDLSFGNLRKLLLAEALSSGEQLLVIDELTAGLDRHGSAAVAAELQRLAASGATTIIADQQAQVLPTQARVLEIHDQNLVDVTPSSADDSVELTLRGPRSEVHAMTRAANSLGFEATP